MENVKLEKFPQTINDLYNKVPKEMRLAIKLILKKQKVTLESLKDLGNKTKLVLVLTNGSIFFHVLPEDTISVGFVVDRPKTKTTKIAEAKNVKGEIKNGKSEIKKT